MCRQSTNSNHNSNCYSLGWFLLADNWSYQIWCNFPKDHKQPLIQTQTLICLLHIIFLILNLLDEGLNLRGTFLDISTKSCGKVWHKGLTYQVDRIVGVEVIRTVQEEQT